MDPLQTRIHRIQFIYLCRVTYFEMFKEKKIISLYTQKGLTLTDVPLLKIHTPHYVQKNYSPFISTSTEICDKFAGKKM